MAAPSASLAAEKVVPTHPEPLHLDYVNTHIDGSPVTISYPDKPAVNTVLTSGNVKFGAHQGKSGTDKVTNTGQTVNQQVAFEIRQHGPLHFAPALPPDLPVFHEVLDKPTLRGWQVTRHPGESTTSYQQHGPGVRIFFTEGRILLSEPDKPNHTRQLWVHKGNTFLTSSAKAEIIDGGDTPMIFNDYEPR